MRAQKLTLAALALTAGLSLSACGADDSGKDSSAKSSSSSSSSSPSSDSSKGGSSSGGGSSDDGASSGGTEARGAKQQGSGDGATEAGAGSGNGSGEGTEQARFCKVADLDMSARDVKHEERGNVIVTMTNKGSTACSVTGFPGVMLKDADNTSNPISRDDNQPRIANLKPGQNGVFNISYQTSPGGEPDESNPTHIEVTPPHESRHITLRWPSGAVKGHYSDVLVHPIHANPMPPQ
ncbi:DUF4232 domain-containing protein [Streptomyces oryzae]|uniref:DUF4232 domain-containing protein n=1 Tax=Streptomyces oryzae TaxID=1434886 RepID=A0ABS3X4K0_9ACTN|nr:DUF4232 domain-containing protein [Streptomyces oryzae]MBO8190303.1 DUF4232 domain-containing protein [Streptomyces oryzae]